MCFNSDSNASSTTTTSTSSTVYDERMGAESGNAIRTSGPVYIGSDELAKAVAEGAIKNSKETLTLGTDFVLSAFTRVLDLTANSLNSADKNVEASRNFAADIISKEQESSDDRLIKVISYVMIAGIAVVALQSGALKGVFK